MCLLPDANVANPAENFRIRKEKEEGNAEESKERHLHGAERTISGTGQRIKGFWFR